MQPFTRENIQDVVEGVPSLRASMSGPKQDRYELRRNEKGSVIDTKKHSCRSEMNVSIDNQGWCTAYFKNINFVDHEKIGNVSIKADAMYEAENNVLRVHIFEHVEVVRNEFIGIQGYERIVSEELGIDVLKRLAVYGKFKSIRRSLNDYKYSIRHLISFVKEQYFKLVPVNEPNDDRVRFRCVPDYGAKLSGDEVFEFEGRSSNPQAPDTCKALLPIFISEKFPFQDSYGIYYEDRRYVVKDFETGKPVTEGYTVIEEHVKEGKRYYTYQDEASENVFGFVVQCIILYNRKSQN